MKTTNLTQLFRFKYILLTLFLLVGFNLYSQNDSKGHWIQVKTNLSGILSETISLELEKPFSLQNSGVFQAGIITNPFDPPENHFVEGYFFRLGYKHYLPKQGNALIRSGFSIQPQLTYSYWRDWETNLRGSFGNRWENTFGIFAVGSFAIPFGKWGMLEPYLGIGFAPTWESFIIENGQPPFGPVEYKWIKVDRAKRRTSYFTHVSIFGDLALTGGLSFGLYF